jgi:hypothetical protein
MQKYGNKMIAQANAMEAQGISTRRTVERLRRLFPDETIPSHDSVHEWRKKRHESLHEELEDNELVIGLMADALVVNKLKWSKDHMDKARLAELVMAAGVYRDKGFKRHEKPTIQSQSITINFISKERPIIEGEVVE